jgi:hypothetical protein
MRRGRSGYEKVHGIATCSLVYLMKRLKCDDATHAISQEGEGQIGVHVADHRLGEVGYQQFHRGIWRFMESRLTPGQFHDDDLDLRKQSLPPSTKYGGAGSCMRDAEKLNGRPATGWNAFEHR